jgi:hypothetical protein
LGVYAVSHFVIEATRCAASTTGLVLFDDGENYLPI